MIYLRKRPIQSSIFRFGIQGTSAAGLTTITFGAPNIPEPGDVIFVNHRSSSGNFSSGAGWTLIGSVSGLCSLVRTVKPGDTSYTYTVTGGSNHGWQLMCVAGTLGFIDTSLTPFPGNPCTLPPISIQKNSTILIYFTSTGAVNATGRTLTPPDFTVALQAGFNLQSIYKQYFAAVTEGFTLTWTGGVPDNSRVTRVQILGAT